MSQTFQLLKPRHYRAVVDRQVFDLVKAQGSEGTGWYLTGGALKDVFCGTRLTEAVKEAGRMTGTRSMSPNRLGKNQEFMVDSFQKNGGLWFAGCGWCWSNVTEHTRIVESLVRRGLVAPKTVGPGYPKGVYRLTEAGKALKTYLD